MKEIIDKLIALVTVDPFLAPVVGLLILSNEVTDFWQRMICYAVMMLFLLVRNMLKISRNGHTKENGGSPPDVDIP